MSVEIRDIIHGAIEVENAELAVIDSPLFQRLRFIKQLGFSEQAYPSASHNRYMHSIGAMHTATLAFRSIFTKPPVDTIPETILASWEMAVRFAALLHDIGHGPLSHTTEFAMPTVGELNLPIQSKPNETQANHEDYTLKILLDSPLTEILEKCGEDYGLRPVHIAGLVQADLKIDDDFFEYPINGNSVDFKPLLQQIISSEVDADRMDYLRRDSLHCGVSYGEFDLDWLLSNLRTRIESSKAYLCIEHKALYTFEDFLISRFHMFLMVYFHRKSVVYDEMLRAYLDSPDSEYSIPASIQQFQNHHDAQLYAHLSESQNPWAKRIFNKNPYKMLVEFHSGIPADSTNQKVQDEAFEKITDSLDRSGVHHLKIHSSSELSKYFRRPGHPIFVRYDNAFSKPSFIPLEKCTDLFMKYEKKRTISRIYVSPEDYQSLKSERRKSELPFKDLQISLN